MPNLSEIFNTIIELKYDRNVDSSQNIRYKVWDSRHIEDFSFIPIRRNDSPKARLEVLTELMERITTRVQMGVQHYEEAMECWKTEEAERKARGE